MNPIFKKLNFKNHQEVVLLNPPDSFMTSVDEMEGWTTFYYSLDQVEEVTFFLAFVTEQAELDAVTVALAPKLKGDAIVWYCYPKKSSKNYTCNFNRDTGFDILGVHGMEGVRMVAIDKDWSALRFRRVEYIKKMTRRKSFAMTKKGKDKTSGE